VDDQAALDHDLLNVGTLASRAKKQEGVERKKARAERGGQIVAGQSLHFKKKVPFPQSSLSLPFFLHGPVPAAF
jgi:hypothetical protein